MENLKTKLKEIIDTLKQGHCTCEYAVDKYGDTQSVSSEEAMKWCLVGAILKCTPHFLDTQNIKKFLMLKLNITDLYTWNDENPDQVIPTLERLYDELQD